MIGTKKKAANTSRMASPISRRRSVARASVDLEQLSAPDEYDRDDQPTTRRSTETAAASLNLSSWKAR